MAEVRVGLAAPFTGRMAATGLAMQRALEAAISDANAAGGVLGQRLVLSVEDDGCASATAQGAANTLLAGKPALVVGHPCSSAAIAARPLYGQAGVLLMAVGARHPDVTRLSSPAPLLRLAGRDDWQGEAAARWLLSHAPSRRVALVHDRTGYARALFDGAVAGLKAAGVDPVSLLPIIAGKPDYEEVALRLKEDRAEALFFAGYPDEAAIIVARLAALGLDVPVLGSDALATPEFARTAEKAGMRIAVLLPSELPPLAAKDASSLESMNEAVAAGLRARGAFEAWLLTVNKMGTFDGAALAQALKGAAIRTPTLGEIGFDANGDLDAPAFAPASPRGGRWIPDN
ncbi:branched-chain amino acid ABC transporter substrate-binding protein [Hyphomicrobium sp. LHD-15]|uniref:branched-chain amino acid ABC transporter substrate-binding protein n=1 Tax=Hyphomicrobium sp. LHD-15 TaxID=3072142 RepID=UPI00280FA499|nr:branched-chain amino acid ABC transporter substrate-binding protein [Hyphomicrobium sp. LHD-15]MDQ8697136.1 branched-chain amino acid ABC transporter substrate-binding protein [Hyphomicrobium sp. LHD-15]